MPVDSDLTQHTTTTEGACGRSRPTRQARTKSISREPNRFRWNEMYLEGMKCIWRERNLFGGNNADFERTKCISRE